MELLFLSILWLRKLRHQETEYIVHILQLGSGQAGIQKQALENPQHESLTLRVYESLWFLITWFMSKCQETSLTMDKS